MRKSTTTEEQAVQEAIGRVLSGDSEAYREVVSRFRDRAYALSVSILKDPDRAKEGVQRAMIRAYTRLGSFRMEASFRTWFFRIVLNEAYQILRDEKRSGVLLDSSEADEPVAGGSDVMNALPDRDIHDELEHRRFYIRRAFLKLPEKESVALRLFYLEELPVRQVAETTGWSESHVKVLLRRARHHMKALLTEEFGLKEEELL
ncbi:MAG: RNA polymerase sigma factor [Balneolaceae bacterium]